MAAYYARAVFDFQGEGETELTIYENEELTIVNVRKISETDRIRKYWLLIG